MFVYGTNMDKCGQKSHTILHTVFGEKNENNGCVVTSRRARGLEITICDVQFNKVYDAIRQLVTPPEKPKRQIGFQSDKDD